MAGLFKGLKNFLTRPAPRRPAAMASASVLLDPSAPLPAPVPAPVRRTAYKAAGEGASLTEPKVAREPSVPTEPKAAREPAVLA